MFCKLRRDFGFLYSVNHKFECGWGTQLMQIVMGTFHLVNISRISGWTVTGTCFVSLSHWKIPRKSGKSKKVCPFSRLCSIYTFLVVCTSSRSMVGHRDLPGFTTKWNNFLPSRNSTFAPTEISGFFPKWKVPNVWTCCPAWPANWNKTENGKEHCDGEWNFFQGKEADIAIFLQMTIIRKIRNKVWSKLVDYSPKQDDHKQRTLKHRNKPNGSKSTNHK